MKKIPLLIVFCFTAIIGNAQAWVETNIDYNFSVSFPATPVQRVIQKDNSISYGYTSANGMAMVTLAPNVDSATLTSKQALENFYRTTANGFLALQQFPNLVITDTSFMYMQNVETYHLGFKTTDGTTETKYSMQFVALDNRAYLFLYQYNPVNKATAIPEKNEFFNSIKLAAWTKPEEQLYGN